MWLFNIINLHFHCYFTYKIVILYIQATVSDLTTEVTLQCNGIFTRGPPQSSSLCPASTAVQRTGQA